MKKVLFVCTGNTCRSPMAEALLKARVKEDEIEVRSAGVQSPQKSPASEGTRMVLQEKGIVHNHQSQQLSEELLQWADVVLTMTAEHKQMIHLFHPEFQKKVFTLKEFAAPAANDIDIADPIGGPLEAYRETAEQIERALDRVLERVAAEGKN